ncbi:MAG TPA: hypothetical protein VIU16_03925, partial [Gaiellaceae bacterium]
AAAVAAAVVAWRHSHSGSGGSSGGKVTPPAQIHLAGVGGYDPYGDGQEHNADAAKATDSGPGNGATAWTTEHYRDHPSLGKQGVGLVLDAQKTVRIGKLGIATDTPGFTAQIQVGDKPGGPFHAVSSSQTVDTNTYFTLSNAEGRYYLVWITRLGSGYDHADVNAVSAG